MEFRFRASGEREANLMNRPPTHPIPFPMNPISSFSCFADEAMQVGYIGFKVIVPKIRSMEELKRELHEERIREEIISRRIAQRRLLEEEARRNLGIVHEMMRHPNECFPQPSRVLPPYHQFGPHLSSTNADLAQKMPIIPAVEETKQLPSEMILAGSERKLHTIFSETSESKILKCTMQKDWSCALCHVSTTSEEELNNHLKGKKHKANAAKLCFGRNKTTQISKFQKTPLKAAINIRSNKKLKKGPTEGGKIQISVLGEMHDVIEKGRFLRCLVCKAKCTGKEAFAEHLKGRRHLAAAKRQG